MIYGAHITDCLGVGTELWIRRISWRDASRSLLYETALEHFLFVVIIFDFTFIFVGARNQLGAIILVYHFLVISWRYGYWALFIFYIQFMETFSERNYELIYANMLPLDKQRLYNSIQVPVRGQSKLYWSIV